LVNRGVETLKLSNQTKTLEVPLIQIQGESSLVRNIYS
jgi:hypothetical protein